jgi:hypothetical protein
MNIYRIEATDGRTVVSYQFPAPSLAVATAFVRHWRSVRVTLVWLDIGGILVGMGARCAV